MDFRQMYIATALAIVALCATFVSSAAAAPIVYVADANLDVILKTEDLGATLPDVLIQGSQRADVVEGLAIDSAGGKVYWAEREGAKAINRADLDGSNYELLIDDPGDVPRGMALDGLGKLYYGNDTPGEIRSANLDGTGDTSIYSGPFANVVRRVKIASSKLYWTDSGVGAIGEMNLDGTGAMQLITGLTDPLGLAVDGVGGKIYWVEASKKIRGADIDGTNIQTVLDLDLDPPAGNAYGLDFFEGMLYFAEAFFDPNDPNAALRRIRVDGTGDEILLTNLRNPITITVVAEPGTTTCDFDGGGCGLSDINLMMSQGDLVAGVSVGSGNQFDLNNDNTINEADITQWLSLTGTANGYTSPMLRGDTDNVGASSPTSRTVDITDFQNFLDGFTGAGSTWKVGNFDGNGVVDITDFSNHFLPNFVATGGGTYGPGQSVPEPSTVLLLGLGGLLLTYLCCRRLPTG